LDFNF
jgi:Methyltransferase FkbM domain